MSAERAARSVALEQAYVYDVYEQLDESCVKCGSKPWPRVREFLDALEAGSLVCDVGSGNGKYLDLNTSAFTIGGDKSTKLCEMTRTTTHNEVILLDNLSLPFRDESLDGILSIAVIHHFTTTERRVCALRELARVLRIGGRIIISVWAMEQSSRRFESQDMLVPVPWTIKQQPHNRCSPTSMLQDDEHNCHDPGSKMLDCQCSVVMGSDMRDFATNKSTTSSNKNKVPANNNNSPTPISSTLSSPNETCYSFVRKAIQKLASGRPSTTSNPARRPWFLDGWVNCAKDLKAPRDRGPRYDPDGCECCDDSLPVQDQPIELRRVDDEAIDHQTLQADRRLLDFPASDRKLPDQNSHQKSQSLSNMSDTTISTTTTNVSCDSSTSNSIKRLVKPKLVKQKQSICHDDCSTDEALDQHTDMLGVRKPRAVLKQRSLNEEFLVNSNARNLEKEQLKHRIHKQTSLNDELIYQQRADSARDSFFSARRLHSIKIGFANKFKTSTTNIEKVAAGSLKNGFVKILQNWNISSSLGQQQQKECCVELQQKRDCADGCERRLSREEGSDSSKDSSLQSDTSVDSEDSFASVIFIPKSNSISPTLSPGTVNYAKSNSPKIKQSSCPTSPRIRQIPLSVYPPLLKQLSSPKPSTKDPMLSLQQISKEIPQDSVNALATKYSVQQIPMFNNNNNKKSPSEAANLPCKKPPVAEPVDKSKYPLVRHMSLYSGTLLVKPLPKLLSLELFNPETDDKDSDSSAVSSPESVDSVVSGKAQRKRKPSLQQQELQQRKLLQAAVDVANSLDVAVDAVVRSNACNVDSSDIQSVMERAFSVSEPEPWNKDCQQHLTDFADRLAAKLHSELGRYQSQSSANKIDLLLGVSHQDPYIHRLSEELYDLGKLSEEIQKQNEYLAKLSVSDRRLANENKCPKCRKCKCACKRTICDKSYSSGSIASKDDPAKVNTLSIESCDSKASSSSANSAVFGGQRSVESADNSAYSGSTASLASCPEWKNQRSLLQIAERSASTDKEPDKPGRHRQPTGREHSDGASQESLPTDGGTVGGEITYHRFYHVFRERELDQLIEKYVENLHIISSYYDHASWCIVAEKVHVWTI